MIKSVHALVLLAPLVGACGSSSEPAPSAIEEPVRIRFTQARTSTNGPAQFFPGPLPTGTQGPVNSIMLSQAFVFPGQQGKSIPGSAANGSTGVGVKFRDVGSGFWVAPVLIPDNTIGAILWSVQLDFGRNMPLGQHFLEVAAVDVDGHWGPASSTPLYVQAVAPGGAAVATLTWDSNADLDLQVVTPNGQVDAKHVGTGGFVDGGFPPGNGVLDRDSNRACVPDGFRQEDVVWADEPTPGLYLAKVDMFSSCGEPATNFLFELRIQGEVKLSIPGRLLAIDADNGQGPGLSISNFQFP